MTSDKPMPELCKHDDPSWCTAECEAKAHAFDEWLKRRLKETNAISDLLRKVSKSIRP